MEISDIQNRFNYHAPKTDLTRNAHEDVRGLCRKLALYLNGTLPDGREKATAITKLEEVMFWTNAAIARNQD